jgi:hypothetical protein
MEMPCFLSAEASRRRLKSQKYRIAPALPAQILVQQKLSQ